MASLANCANTSKHESQSLKSSSIQALLRAKHKNSRLLPAGLIQSKSISLRSSHNCWVLITIRYRQQVRRPTPQWGKRVWAAGAVVTPIAPPTTTAEGGRPIGRTALPCDGLGGPP